jgi:hypothetical protein
MVWHLVLMKPKAHLSAAERQALLDAFNRAVRDIPTVREVRVGRRVTHGAAYEIAAADAADFVVSIGFDDLAGLQTYRRARRTVLPVVQFNVDLRLRAGRVDGL